MRTLTFIIFLLFIVSCDEEDAYNPVLVEKNVNLETLLDNLNKPWGLAFLPDESLLITEKSGSILHYKNGISSNVNGVPNVISAGQGGLLDIFVHPNFEENKLIYFTASVGFVGNYSTALFRSKFTNGQLEDLKIIFQADDYEKSESKHFGSRIVIDNNAYIFIGLGDRYNDRDYAQNLSYHNGKVIRIKDDGGIPEDNPFFKTHNAKAEIWSYGHRNIQGLAIHPTTGELWAHEHGPKGGDEINIIKKGKNYGWPLATFGIDYDGSIISDDTSLVGAEDPIFYWTPSIAPCGMNFYFSETISQWNGNLFIGALAGKHLNRLVIEDNIVIEEERLYQDLGRFRQLIQGPDGYIYFITESPSKLYRITPI